MQIPWSGTIKSKGDMSWFGSFWVKTAENNCKNCKVPWGSLRWRSGTKTDPWDGSKQPKEGKNDPGRGLGWVLGSLGWFLGQIGCYVPSITF